MDYIRESSVFWRVAWAPCALDLWRPKSWRSLLKGTGGGEGRFFKWFGGGGGNGGCRAQSIKVDRQKIVFIQKDAEGHTFSTVTPDPYRSPCNLLRIVVFKYLQERFIICLSVSEKELRKIGKSSSGKKRKLHQN